MSYVEIIELLVNSAAVLGAIASVLIFRYTVKRERKIITIDTFTKIRDKYPNIISKMSEEEKLNYLRDMEFFCIGINNGIYDFCILRKMSGQRLLNQYRSGMCEFVDSRRKRSQKTDDWCEYKKVMYKLEKYYV